MSSGLDYDFDGVSPFGGMERNASYSSFLAGPSQTGGLNKTPSILGNNFPSAFKPHNPITDKDKKMSDISSPLLDPNEQKNP